MIKAYVFCIYINILDIYYLMSNKKNFIGKNINSLYKNEKVKETWVTFEQVKNRPELNDDNLKKPSYQGALLEEKYQSMVAEYLDNSNLFKLKNKIIVGCLNKNWYLIDGQHRLEMAKILKDRNNINDEFVFCWYQCENEEEMKQLFNSLNKDSIKNEFYIDNEDFKNIVIEEFITKLKENYKTSFSRSKKQYGYIKCIEEFIDELKEIEYFEKFKYSQSAFDHIIKMNEQFYKQYNYKMLIDQHADALFYKDEQPHINSGIIFTLKRNNFIQYISDKKSEPLHKSKTQKKTISRTMRNKVWNKHFGESVDGICLVSFCNNKLDSKQKNGWECGHIISDYNDGKVILSNLRPICAECNRDMGRQNWIDYDPDYRTSN